MEITKLLFFMDNLRYARKVSQEDYLLDIVSQRQYYRYVNGDSLPPFDIIIKLSERLGMSFERLINQFIEASDDENKHVKAFFNLVISRKDSEALKLFDGFSKQRLLENANHKFIIIGKSILDYNRDRMPKHELVRILKEQIDFASIMKSEILQDLELYILGLVMQYSDEDRKPILKRILYLNKENKLYTSGNRLYISQVYFWVLKNLGVEKRYDDLLQIADDAILFAKSEYSVYLLEYFYYYKALAYYKKKDLPSFEAVLFDCISVLKVSNMRTYEHFKEMILKDTKIHIDDFYVLKMKIK